MGLMVLQEEEERPELPLPAERQPSTSQEGFHQNPTTLVPDLRLPASRTVRNVSAV